MSNNSLKIRKVSLQERAFTIGDFIGVNGYRVNRTALKNYLADVGYQVCETPHFLIGQHPTLPKKLVVHWFAPEEIDVTLGSYFLSELKPLGILSHPNHFSDLFGVIMFSLFPHDIQRAQHLFATNTLRKYRALLENGIDSTHSDSHSSAEIFATLYRRVLELQIGESILDAGCSFGFLPILMGEHLPTLNKAVGIDIQGEPFAIARTIAEEHHIKNVLFLQADLLVDNSSTLGCFSTVTLLHVLEHFTEQQMYQVLTHLLHVVSHRLIIAVPYEAGEPEVAYDHKQLFSRQKLEAVGQWCIQQMNMGRVAYEYCEGGLLIVDRE